MNIPVPVPGQTVVPPPMVLPASFVQFDASPGGPNAAALAAAGWTFAVQPVVTRLASRAGVSIPGDTLLKATLAEKDHLLGVVASSGATWLRVDWNQWIAEGQPGVMSWGPFDAVVVGCRVRNLTVLGVLGNSPPWEDGQSVPWGPPLHLSDWTTFVTAAVQRYAPQGVHNWEVWNEPNQTLFWGNEPVSPTAYAALFAATYRAVKAVDPSATVISGGLAPESDSLPGSLSPRTFLDQFLSAATALGVTPDGVGIHPYDYPYGPNAVGEWNQWETLPETFAVMTKHGLGNLKLWATEYGVPTGTSAPMVSEAVQASVFIAAMSTWETMPFAGPIFWYTAQDYATGSSNPEDNFGLVRTDGTPKPGLAAFQAAMAK